MAIYFAILTASLQSLFLTCGATTTPHQPIEAEPTLVPLLAAVLIEFVSGQDCQPGYWHGWFPAWLVRSLSLLSTGSAVVAVSNECNKWPSPCPRCASSCCLQRLANPGQALLSGPDCLWFSLFWHSVALSWRILAVLRFEDVLVASNLPLEDRRPLPSKIPIVGMTLAATVWATLRVPGSVSLSLNSCND